METWNQKLKVALLVTTFDYFYGVTKLQLVLRHRDYLSKTLLLLTPCQGKEIADLTLQTINSLRSESEFELLFRKRYNKQRYWK